MKGRKGCAVSFLVLALALSLWLMIRVRQQRQEAQARTSYYAAILEQAPCIESVCPGFDEGRDRVLERLAHNDAVRGVAQGTHLIGLLFTHGEEEVIGSGVISFTTDAQGIPTIVRRISFRLHDLKLESVFNTFGEPDQFLFISGCGMGLRVHAKLFYLSQGVEVSIDYTTRRPDSQVLTGDRLVHAIEYFRSSDFQDHILESLERSITETVAYDLHPSVTADDFIAQIQPWPGIAALPTPTADFCPR